MWGFLQDAEVSLGSINRGLMLPMSRESWILKEGAVIGSPVQREAWERSTGQLGTREPSVSSSRPPSRQSSRPKTASRPSSVGSCRKAKRTAVTTLSELKESASTRTAAWLRAYAAYEQSLLQGSGAPLGSPAGDPRRSSLQRMHSAPESLELRPSSATHRGPGERRGRAPVTPTATPQQRQPTPAGGKRLRRQCSGAQNQLGDERLPRREERIAGWPAPWADTTPSSPLESFGPRPNTTPCRTRDKKNEMGKVTTTGLVRAVECDKKFQAILLDKWRRDTDLDTIAERIHRRQVCQFFDFLKNKEGDMNTESAAVAYIEEGFADPEFIEAELSKAAPDLNSGPVPQASQELPAAKKAAIRQVLLLYGQISRPSSQGVQEVLYRSTWCRFILDSNLVALEAEDTERPSFHKSVRLFDNISKYGKEGGQRYANLDHCVTLVVQLMMQINMPASLAWELFEEGLIKAERTVEAIYGEVQHQVDECVQVLAKEITEEAIMERRIDMFGKHGSPPQSFQGSLLAWTRGLRFWINVTTTSCLPENTVERIEQSLANEQFARDEITEPGCLYTVAKYEGLFEELFLAYCYEERTAVKEDENGKTRNEDVKHMSFAAFFRFCADFHVFPGLVSFEEAWVTYKNADCIVILGTKARPTKVKQFKKSEVSPSRVSAILGLRTLVNRVRKGKDDQDEDKKTDTSNSEKEEEEHQSSSSSDDESSEGMDSGLGESPVSFHRVRAGTAGDEIRSRGSSNASKSSKTHTVPASIASVGTVNSLQIPGQPSRSRRGVNDSEVKAALAVHRRQSIGPGDQATIPIIRTLSEKGEQVPAESERSPLNGEGNASDAEKKEVVKAPSRQGSKNSARGGSKGSAAGSPPPEQEEPEKPTAMKGSKFLHMLGSLSADKVKDIFAGSPRAPEKKEVVPPRVKTVTADFQWLAKSFRDMNDKELKSYSLLIALDECCRDHFLNIRGLVRVGRITESKQGLLSYLGFMEMMKKFRITHGFETSSALQEFMRAIDPSSDGMLDPVELEKAVSAVHEDDQRRHPTAEPKGGPFAAKLGEEARKLSALPIEVDGNGKEIPAAFSSAAFTECLLLLGYRHMHGSGVPVKGAAPAAAKAMYLINFLHHQHDCLAKAMAAKKEKAAAEAAEQVAANLVAPRSPPRSPEKGPSPAPSVAPSPKAAAKNSLLPPAKRLPSTLNRMVGAARKVMRDNRVARMGDKRNAVVTAVLDQGAEAEAEPGSSRGASKEPGSASPKGRGAGVAAIPKEETVPVPDSASYTNVSEVFMKNNQDLFKKWLDGDGRLPQLSPWFSESNQTCSKCKRKRDQHGIGNVFCHFCSCVDSKPLNETLLYPVMERARMRRKQKTQKEAPAAPIRVATNGRGVDAASQRSGSNN